MTEKDFMLLAERVGTNLMSLEDTSIKSDKYGVSMKFTKRETMALGVGCGLIQTMLEVEPPKPVNEFTDEDIYDLTHIVLSSYAELILFAMASGLMPDEEKTE